MISLLSAFLALGFSAPQAGGISYDISFPNAAHHEARVVMTVTGAPRAPLAFRMAASSPGRYALTGFAKNVYDVSATDSRGRALTVTHTDPEGWSVAGHDGTVRMSYTVFGDRTDGTYLQVDASHAHMNMPATFMWVRGFDRPIRVTFRIPDGSGWKVATQLMPTSDPATFTAPDLGYFMDSPTELSNYTLREWQVTSGGRTQTIRIALHHLGTEAEADSFAAMAKRIVDQQLAVYGEAPAYEPGTYTFIADYLPWANGDGMEHRNSTVISSSASIAQAAQGLLGTLSHEYFHSWNMERIRSRALEPFDFSRANMSDELWVGEGFTQYYGGLLTLRAGLGTAENFARGMGFTVNAVVNGPGRRFFGPIGMSQQAPWRDGAAVLDQTNAGNVFISYYTYGAALALALDLHLRGMGTGRSLDGLMRDLWQRHGRTGAWYTVADIERALARYGGDAAFAADFFTRYVRGHDVPDYAALLAKAGMTMRRAAAGVPYIGNDRFTFDARGGVFQFGTQAGTPWYEAGLDRGDRVMSLDGRAFTSDSVVAGVRAAHRVGDRVPVEFESRGHRGTAQLTIGEDPRFEIVLMAGADVTPDMLSFRRAWLGTDR